MTRLRARWWMWRYVLLRPELVVVMAIGAVLQLRDRVGRSVHLRLDR